MAPAADVVPVPSGADVPRARGRPALGRCTRLDPQSFATGIWGRAASLSRREDLPTGFEDLFSLDAVDTLVGQQGLRTPFLRVVKDGRTLPAGRFTRGGGVGATIADQVADDSLARLFADGCTIVLQGLHRVWSPLVGFAQDLAADLGHPVQVNGYVTPPQSQGLSAHYDVHDVFVLQIAGEKRWTVHEPVRTAPLRDEPWQAHRAAVERRAAQQPLLEVTLRPGDALYLPRGFLHSARTLGGISAHLTVGVHPWTRHHLLQQVLDGLGRGEGPADEAIRAALPVGVDVTDPAGIAADLRVAIDTLTALLAPDGAPVAPDVARRLEAVADTAGRAAPVGPIAQARALAGLDPGSRLRWRAHLPARLAVEDGEAGPVLVVRTPEVTTRLPPAARAGVERLLAGETVAVAELCVDLPGGAPVVTGPDRLEVARALLRDAVAVPA